MDVTKRRPPEEERREPDRFRTCVDNYPLVGRIDTESRLHLIVDGYSPRPDGLIDHCNRHRLDHSNHSTHT
jgi:hypothetical protein